MSSGLDVVEFGDVPLTDVLALLERSFGDRRSLDQLRWKHVEGPWGASRGSAAYLDGRLAGIRPMVPWLVRDRGRDLPVLRAMDGAVAPEFRGRHIFQTLVRHEMHQAQGRRVLYSTCVPASREAYRKLGWRVMPPQPRRTWGVAPLPGARVAMCDPGDVPAPLARSGLAATAWQAKALAWRFDPRSGHRYHACRLVHSDVGTSLVYRVDRRGNVPVLVILLATGAPNEHRHVVRAAARRARCVVAVAQGSQSMKPPRLCRRRPGSTVALWDSLRRDEAQRRGEPSWAFSGADLEGIL